MGEYCSPTDGRAIPQAGRLRHTCSPDGGHVIVLRDCGVRTYLIAGIAVEVGIEPTVRHSADLGYIPIVVRDACGAGNQSAGQRALQSIAFAGDALIVDTDEVCSILNSDD